MMETLNCSITKPFLTRDALLSFNFNPFKTNAGLNEDKYNDG